MMDSVTSAVFMNNIFADVDSAFVVDRNEARFLLINNLDANADDVYEINDGTANWAEIAISSDSVSAMTTPRGTEGKLWIDANRGLYLNPRGQSDIEVFPLVGDSLNPSFSVWGDSSEVPVKGVSLQTDTSGHGVIKFANRGIITNYNSAEEIRIIPANEVLKVAGSTKTDKIVIPVGTESSFVSDTAHSLIYMSSSGGSYPFSGSGHLIIQPRTNSNRDIVLAAGSTTPSARVIVKSNGNVGIGTNEFGNNGVGVVSISNGTAPTNGATDASMIYAKDVSSSSEMFVMDETGNETQISPHNPETGEWEFYSRNVRTGRVYRVRMKKLMTALQTLLHAQGDTIQYIEEYFDETRR